MKKRRQHSTAEGVANSALGVPVTSSPGELLDTPKEDLQLCTPSNFKKCCLEEIQKYMKDVVKTITALLSEKAETVLMSKNK